jgi:hypothetical protein
MLSSNQANINTKQHDVHGSDPIMQMPPHTEGPLYRVLPGEEVAMTCPRETWQHAYKICCINLACERLEFWWLGYLHTGCT